MLNTLRLALRTLLVTLGVTGLAYPLVVTGLARLLFPAQAAGSLVRDEHGTLRGSELIGQSFSNPAYLQPRPSAAGPRGYDASASSGSNLGPSSARLRERVVADLARLRADNPNAGPVPDELVTASASGLDPHLSPQAALWQVPRIAAARNVAPERVQLEIQSAVEGRELGFLGEPRVNVLAVNMTLDRLFGAPPAVPPAKDRALPATGR